MNCNLCKLHLTAKGPVEGWGNPESPYWLIGEAPGAEEDEQGIPFIGAAGIEQDKNYLLRAGLQRDLFYITNLVKCRPPLNRDPEPEEIAACRQHLELEMQQLHPQAVVGTLGRFATSAFMGEAADMVMYHGIPLRRRGRVIVPIYHPALGLHSTFMMTQIAEDYRALAAVIRGDLAPEDHYDPIPEPEYMALCSPPFDSLLNGKIVGVDTESVGPALWSAQLCCTPGKAYMAMASDADVMAWVKDYLGNPEVLTLLHNAQHDLPMLAQAGIVPARWVDTMLMANLLQNLPKGLKALAYRLCGMTMQSYSSLVDPITEARTLDYMGRVMAWKWPKPPTMRVLESRGWREKQPWSMHTVAKSIINSWAKGTIRGRAVFDRWHDNPNRHQAEAILGKLEAATLADVDFETVLHYACRDADATRRVYPILNTRIADANLQGPLDRDYSIVPMIIAMEKVGLQVDTNHMEELGESYAKRKLEVIDEIAAMFMRYIDPASHDQVRDLLFNQLGLKPKWRTKGGSLSTNQEVLETIEQDHPVVPLILKYRELDKMQGTFVGGVLSNCARHTDHRCHTRLSMIRVLTGRLAAKEPNLLAFPQPDRSPEGKPLRDGFTTDADKVYLSGDYSQIELRVLAHMSQEPTMMEVFHSGGDIHRETAAVVFKVTPAQVTSEQRYAVKTVNFGIPYGITAPGLFRFLGAKGYTKKDCSRLIDDWFNRFDKVAAYMESVRAFARRHGYVADMFGRRRLIPEVRSAHEFVREAGLRQACNLPIQSGAGGIIKEAMGQLVPFYELLQRQDLYTWPLLQIHDDLLWETLRSILPWAVPVIKEVMESCVTLSVPVIVDFKVGNTWGTMEKYGSVTTTIGS